MTQLFRYSNMPFPNFIIVILILAILAFSSGCTEKRGVLTGEKAPEIPGTDIHGEHVSLGQLKGKVVVLCFWASCCSGDSLKSLEPYYKLNKGKGLSILAINMGDSREVLKSYAKKYALTFTQQTDEPGTTSKEYGVYVYPTLFILDREGIIRKKILGDIDTAQLDKIVAQYL